MDNARFSGSKWSDERNILPTSGRKSLNHHVERILMRLEVNVEKATAHYSLGDILSKATKEWRIAKRPVTRDPPRNFCSPMLLNQVRQVIIPVIYFIEVIFVELQVRQQLFEGGLRTHKCYEDTG